ncbi:MAG: isoprenylcysteine carboxylmethyltransferase family protein [Myxococcales bacterium]|nr:MAG: isoprenylcysteine carboxylmethyltransferase family protein [Myxococcales bacterium]
MSTEAESNDGAAVRFPPPFVPLIALALGIVIHLSVLPLRIPLEGMLRYGLAAVLLGLGVFLMVGAVGLFRRTGQDPKPWLGTPEIISTGVYRFTRNPMYVSMGLLQAGIGVAVAKRLWVVVFVPVVWLVIYLIAIRYEEAYLEEKFGSLYTDYKASVRRWF